MSPREGEEESYYAVDSALNLAMAAQAELLQAGQRLAATQPEFREVRKKLDFLKKARTVRRFLGTLWHLSSSVSCVNAMQKKQPQLPTFASSCFSVTACQGWSICPAAIVPVG